MRSLAFFFSFSAFLFSTVSCAAEANASYLGLSIYNNNLALVKDTRRMDLKQGENLTAFEGVASAIKPESVMIYGEGIKVLEQNYDYNLLTPYNILEKSVGQKVKTAVQNPENGKDIFQEAKLVSAVNSQPVLEFDYGVETAFQGRIVFEKLPQGLYVKPTLAAKIYSTSAALKDLTLVYLTQGLSWTTNYVARVLPSDKLDLTAWVSLKNESGADYQNAHIQLIAGNVNAVSVMQNFARPMLKMARGVMMDVVEAGTDAAAPQELSGYYLYTLPFTTDLKDQQTKQISLMEKNGVSYTKEGRLNSSLYFGRENLSSFEKVHPALYYLSQNTAENGLGLPMPAGVVRFYENDKDGQMQFIGEDNLPHTAQGEKIELKLGSIFDVYANGKILKATKKSENKKPQANGCGLTTEVWAYDAVVEFLNGGTTDYEVLFKQNINKNIKITTENLNGEAVNANLYQWRVHVPSNGSETLKFSVEVTTESRTCN